MRTLTKVKIIVYSGIGLTIAGVAYYLYQLTQKFNVENKVTQIFNSIQAAGASVGTIYGINRIRVKMLSELMELIKYLNITSSAKISAYYIDSWYNKYSIWFNGLLKNDFVKSNQAAIDLCNATLNEINADYTSLKNRYVKTKKWDSETPLPDRTQLPEFIREVIEMRIKV